MSKPCTWPTCPRNARDGLCFVHKPKRPIQRLKMPRKQGKYAKKWLETRNKWLEQNKQPYYFCYLCNKMMTKTQLTLDHVIPRSRAPELRYKLSNLKPCCWQCNSEKGSKVYEQR